MEVVWLKESTNDLKAIGRHIEKDNPVAAYQVLVKIKASGDSLQHNPELGRLGRVKKTRELIVADLPYILPYYIKKKQIRILAVMHTSRKWPDTFTNLP
ncbi:MAG: type II toxin-antitoxin system RelE/ParE family toxin [Nitrospina sp.]|jgi:addiction module RelE/StbE family toxin|nr:type II toxin-antitoxin system RelE/ParE family toxin [Nitrospina sp.]MBT3413660.1 type II toxin-antitoxin system RelE/ParE family toxin [Nitrospina sp.]MBT3856971.1 type II toxin-antitoxin system RelE/ParE family toxin [Nitrospina sp.]MBT4103808.1 type II toxin-antitoxin system RelE/ParE family toxin [Nitrospina sp.]MBT4388804.1 type II toxin-antitoxin system RelE/ParE family toxin [Nitrospina sp.]